MSTPDPIFLAETRAALSAMPKRLSPKWLYDQKGSELFEKITHVPEYYPTRTELSIFEAAMDDIANTAGEIEVVVEYGSGSSRKTRHLLEAIRPKTYMPIDISADFLQDAADSLADIYPWLQVSPLVADFTARFSLPDEIGPSEKRLGFFPGSTIGNLDLDEAREFLVARREGLGKGSQFLIGVDLIKDQATLEAAYDDGQGVTAAFNLNLLERMNRELGTDFAADAYAHKAVWNEERSRIEMHIVAKDAQEVRLSGDTYGFAAGETLHTESSHKYSPETFEQLVRTAGWTVTKHWSDPKNWFGVFLLTAG